MYKLRFAQQKPQILHSNDLCSRLLLHVVHWKSTNVSEEGITFILNAEE
jgi:hypothetical protein